MVKPDPNLERDRRWLADQIGTLNPDDLQHALDELFAPPPPARTEAALSAVMQQLEEEADRPLYYGRIEVPLIGHIFLGVTAKGLAAVAFGGSEQAFLERMKHKGRYAVVRDLERIQPTADQIRRYLAGEQTAFDTPVDLSGLTAFQQRVLTAACEVPRGQVVSYAELARRIGQPRAARAVGQALGRNPVPLVIPCHRVLASDGSMGGYSGRGGVRTKRALLELEGALP
jgi:methylated-DNA-[protein]-cysteine S-methyltransferase